jgi:hypothetical protein
LRRAAERGTDRSSMIPQICVVGSDEDSFTVSMEI